VPLFVEIGEALVVRPEFLRGAAHGAVPLPLDIAVAVEMRVVAADPGIEHGPANAAARGIVAELCRACLDRVGRDVHEGALGRVAPDPTDLEIGPARPQCFDLAPGEIGGDEALEGLDPGVLGLAAARHDQIFDRRLERCRTAGRRGPAELDEHLVAFVGRPVLHQCHQVLGDDLTADRLAEGVAHRLADRVLDVAVGEIAGRRMRRAG